MLKVNSLFKAAVRERRTRWFQMFVDFKRLCHRTRSCKLTEDESSPDSVSHDARCLRQSLSGCLAV